jgi:Mce-associated membrane protein
VVVPPAPDQRSVTQELPPPDVSTASRSRIRGLIAGALVLVIVAAGGTLAWLMSQRTGEAAEIQRERERVMAVGRTFVLQVNTYGPELLATDGTMPEYREAIDAVISAKLSATFELSVGAAEATVAQAGLGRTAEVFSAGVLSIDSDSATALVAGSFTNTYPDPDDETQRVEDLPPLPLRLRLELVKIDGEWLIDEFSPVLGAESEAPPALDPSDLPSTPDPSGPAPSTPATSTSPSPKSGTPVPSEEASE